MTDIALRHKLQSYLEVADIKKIKALYTMFEVEIEATLSDNTLTDAQLEEVEKRRADYLSGKSKTYSWEDAKKQIGKRI